METNIIWLGFVASLLAGLCSAVGALAVFVVRRISDRTEDLLLSVAAGIMLAASFFSLILPGIEYAEAQVATRSAAVAIVIAGIFIGAWALYIVHRYLPHEHFVSGREGPDTAKLERIWLFVIAITLHNFPEGMAVGVGFAGGNTGNGVALAAGIGLQNIPEGLAVAVSMRAIGYSRWESFGFAALTGLVEPVGGLFGAGAVSLAEPMMPWTLGFAAGAMLFIISDEIIPETHRGGYQNLATFSLLGGFGAMMFLDATLG
ncbi:MAG: ZIP family metal transporter [Gammaproteobacteria bacterium]|nr:ZIP family metal transporter [Gammaproteobacteria bacterium]